MGSRSTSTITIQSSAWGAFWARLGMRALDKRLAKRERAVVAAVAEVDPDFSLDPAELHRFAVERIAAQRPAWKAGDVSTLPELLHVTHRYPPGRYTIDYQGDPVARVQWAYREADDAPWRIVLFVSVFLHRRATSGRVALADLAANEYEGVGAWWTLVRDGDGWRIVQVEENNRGFHYRKDPLPNAPHDAELHDEATVEVALGDRAAAPDVAALCEVDAPVRSRLLDLSLVDGRFAPDAIAACVGEIARAWEDATERGERAGLERWSAPETAERLCRPTPNGVRRVRNLAVEQVRITALDSVRRPPRVDVEARLHGLRWLADLHGSHSPISGSDNRPRSFTEHWTLELPPDGNDGDPPWHLVAVEHPGHR